MLLQLVRVDTGEQLIVEIVEGVYKGLRIAVVRPQELGTLTDDCSKHADSISHLVIVYHPYSLYLRSRRDNSHAAWSEASIAVSEKAMRKSFHMVIAPLRPVGVAGLASGG